MIYRIFAQKDTFITDYQLNGVQRTGSNFGASEILHLYKVAPMSGAIGVPATASIARVLTQFDLSGLLSIPNLPSSGVSYFLKMTDAEHKKTTPSSFDVEVQALSQSWDEGKGRDVDAFSDKGVANWVKAKSNVYWTARGGDTVGAIATTHFDDGRENLEVDVTDIVQSWISGGVTNNGLMVRLSSSQEADFQNYFVKMFHGRNTFFKDKRPYLEARWDDSLRDDRNNFLFDVPGSLFLRRVVHGQLQDLPFVGTGSIGVRITDTSSSLLVVTGSWVAPGTYSASFTLPSGSYSGSIFNDIWFDLANPGVGLMTGTFGVGDNLNVTDVSPKKYFVSVTNLRDTYEDDELVRLNLFIRPHDYNPARVLTASLDANGSVMTKAYWRITNDRTDEVVVPFSTGTLEYTRLSYDQKGNYLNLYMSSLSPGNVYRLSFLFDVDGQRQYVADAGLKFRVV
jgi:hypothetical protein